MSPRRRASRGRHGCKAGIDGIWALLMPLVIVGGMKFGIFTPTEAAVAAGVYALVVGAVRLPRTVAARSSTRLLVAAAKTTAIVDVPDRRGAGLGLAHHHLADLPPQIGAMLEPFMGNKTLLMFVIMVLVVIVGTALDFAPTVMILTPVLMPVIKRSRHRPGLLRRAVHHEQRHRPDHAAGGHRAQRGLRRRQDLDERGDQGRVALPLGRARSCCSCSCCSRRW